MTLNLKREKTGSLYLFNKSVCINFYDKKCERLNNNVLDFDSENILRLEVQCKKSKTNAIKYKYNFDVKFLLYFLSKELSI